MVNFVIFVVNGLAVLKSMDKNLDPLYSELVSATYKCPFLSFKGKQSISIYFLSPFVVVPFSSFLINLFLEIKIHLSLSDFSLCPSYLDTNIAFAGSLPKTRVTQACSDPVDFLVSVW